jgi:ATP-dependent RNA helicase DeaD
MWTERHVREIKLASQGSIYEGFLALANDLKQRPDADDLIAFMLRYFFTNRRKELIGTTEQQTTERMSGRFETKKEGSSSGGGKFDKGPRRGERERGGRSDRERPPRSDRPDRSETPTVPVPAVAREPLTANGAEPTAVDAAPLEQAPRPPRPPRPPQAPRAKKLTDRELFELLQSGKPLPPVDDPTAGDSDTTAEAPAVTRAPRAERSDRTDGERGTRRERGPERERGPRRDTPRAAEAGQARLWVNLGRAGGLDAQGITLALEGAGAPAGKVDHVEVLNAFSFVFVPEGEVPAFEALTGKLLGERALKVEKAKK